ncbi:tRNA pseudouridine synthase A [Leifsonia flava]|uniref:tRNA pseudouridine synthase A n=1 Tax=Orlajensenia leifsoniae TaxID=2561933 RepID=A0A4Y9RA86_9MICO|nr:tRNA pseudouridine synthase A [Leifsonia flava]TFW00076.1 tRNA pseudouridine(38-40) synthase TruA [Leifsonia flava]
MADEEDETSSTLHPPLEGTRRIRLDIAYDGTDFNGWGRQPNLRTVQGDIELALSSILRRYGPPPTLVVAGRTDAGVHATGQVAHLDLTDAQAGSLLRPDRGRNRGGERDAGTALARRLNGILSQKGDIVISRGSLAPVGFDARFGALWRRYSYRLADQTAVRNPLHRVNTTWHHSRLDGDAMEAAAASLCGLHDFAAYCKPRDGATTIRTLQAFTWERAVDGVLTARLQADAFCHSMVRALVGACVLVGAGKLAPGDPVALREAAERTNAFMVMPARGLTLTQVGYPDDLRLAARAAETRQRRGPAHRAFVPPEASVPPRIANGTQVS